LQQEVPEVAALVEAEALVDAETHLRGLERGDLISSGARFVERGGE
jgi:hypothetical protein